MSFGVLQKTFLDNLEGEIPGIVTENLEQYLLIFLRIIHSRGEKNMGISLEILDKTKTLGILLGILFKTILKPFRRKVFFFCFQKYLILKKILENLF